MTIGVTGGIGSGKSTVCRLFGGWGAIVLDADREAHDALEDSDVYRALVQAFGSSILDGSGQLLRRELGRVAFADDPGRETLTGIVWPAVGRRLKAGVRKAVDEDRDRPVVIEAPVLLEWGDPDGLCDVVVVVTGSEDLRIERTMENLGLTEEEVRARMRHQMSEEEKVRHADHVIVNDGTLAQLETRAREVWATLTG